jgi:antitoxin component of RelBE/YafQ-DinJ toxin-antitoxin module
LNFGTSVFKTLGITVKKAVDKRVNCKIKKISYVAMDQPWPVLNFGPSVVKTLGITVKKAVEKCLNRKIKKHASCRNASAMARLDLWDQCI